MVKLLLALLGLSLCAQSIASTDKNKCMHMPGMWHGLMHIKADVYCEHYGTCNPMFTTLITRLDEPDLYSLRITMNVNGKVKYKTTRINCVDGQVKLIHGLQLPGDVTLIGDDDDEGIDYQCDSLNNCFFGFKSPAGTGEAMK